MFLESYKSVFRFVSWDLWNTQSAVALGSVPIAFCISLSVGGAIPGFCALTQASIINIAPRSRPGDPQQAFDTASTDRVITTECQQQLGHAALMCVIVGACLSLCWFLPLCQRSGRHLDSSVFAWLVKVNSVSTTGQLRYLTSSPRHTLMRG